MSVILYSDASFSVESKKAGIACIAFSDSDQVAGISTKQVCADDVVSAELQGIIECLHLAEEISCNRGTLYSDCQIAVGLIKKPYSVPRKYQEMVYTILDKMGNIRIEWGCREGNSQADALAVLASRRSELEHREAGCFKFNI